MVDQATGFRVAGIANERRNRSDDQVIINAVVPIATATVNVMSIPVGVTCGEERRQRCLSVDRRR